MSGPVLTWQPSLFELGRVNFDRAFLHLTRHELGSDAWVDYVPGWVKGAAALFEELLAAAAWSSRVVHMYERKIPEPRLAARWQLGEAPKEPALAVPRFEDRTPPPVISEMAEVLGERYGVRFTSVGCNLYRDGADSVAWHGDRVARDLTEATIAIVSLGEPRPFRLRPKGGGRSLCYKVGGGDLLVMGGSCQRTWDHQVPKVASAGPRISVTFRHAYD